VQAAEPITLSYMTRLVTVAALLAVSAAQAAVPIFPLKDVRAGMRGTGRTVFNGDKVEDFQVEILGVLENVGPKQSIILARLSGGPLEHTGIMQGMSGSPVYIDGKLAGAVALAFPYAKDPIAGIRPIEEMLVAGTGPSPQPSRARIADGDLAGLLHALLPAREVAGFGDTRMTEVATPLSLSGFSAAAVERFAPELRRLGLEPRQGISTGGAPEDRMGDPKRLEPGSMISVELMTGDMSAGADGTLTVIDGGKVYAFGHRFLGVGPASLPFTRSEVIALLANVNTSFKISSARELMGVISQDRNAAISGDLGQRAEMVPVDITVTEDTKRAEGYHISVVRDPFLSPFLVQMAVFSAIDAVERASGASSVAVNGSIEFDGGRDPIRTRNVFAGDQTSATAAAISTATPLAYLMQGGFDELRIRRVSVQLEAFSVKKELSIGQVYLSRREIKPGETVQLTVQLDGDGGLSLARQVQYTVPTGTAPGTLYFTVADGAQTTLTDLRQALADSPRSPEQMISNVNRLRASDKAYVRVWRPQPSYEAGGGDLPDPPPSVAMVLAAAQSVTQSKNSKLGEMTIDAGDRAVGGSKTVQLEVKE
jgi:hypothetical protein